MFQPNLDEALELRRRPWANKKRIHGDVLAMATVPLHITGPRISLAVCLRPGICSQ